MTMSVLKRATPFTRKGVAIRYKGCSPEGKRCSPFTDAVYQSFSMALICSMYIRRIALFSPNPCMRTFTR